MDLEKINKLKENHKKGLELCLEKILHWETFKGDYEALKQRLETLSDKLCYDITVPLGPNAFTMGSLVHTNEVMVLLGDNWFAEVSAKQAAGIASRRMDQCSKMIEELRKEEEQFKNWLSYISEVTNNEDLVEIIETYDPEIEEQWRRQHVENVKTYAQKLSEAKKTLAENNPETTEKDYVAMLEELELREYQEESETSNVECSVECMQHSDESCESNNSTHSPNCCEHRESVSDSEEKLVQKDCESKGILNGCECLNSTKHVKWLDLSKQKVKKITFKHSNHKNSSFSKDRQKNGEHDSQIQSPSDIYKHFGNLFQTTPKSILKIKSPPIEVTEPFFPPDSKSVPNEVTDTLQVKNDHEEIKPAFTGSIYERSEITASPERTSSRPMSHFKSSRKNSRK